MKTKRQLLIIYFATMLGTANAQYNTDYGVDAGNGGSSNTSIGYKAGDVVTWNENSFLGYQAGLKSNGSWNTYLGANAGYNAVSGISNTFVGSSAGRDRENGYGNSFFGERAGYGNRNGSQNVFLGFHSGAFNGGERNIFIGSMAGSTCSGSDNVLIGYYAGNSETGSNKLHIGNSGYTGYPLIYGDFVTGNVAIGSTSTSAGYKLYIYGNAYAWSIYTPSDRRFKQNEKVISNSLQKINELNGMTYEFKREGSEDRKFAEGMQYGFIAQDLRKILPELVREDSAGYLAVNYQGVIPVLVEALKELSAEVNLLKAQLVDKNVTSGALTKEFEGVILYQNQPNPFTQSTNINYELPHEVAQAVIRVFDSQGKELIVFDNLKSGKGEVVIFAGQLQAGLYYYSLVVDGKTVDTKRMVFSK